MLRLPDILSTTYLTTPGVRVKDGLPMRQYQIRAAHKVFTGTPTKDPKTGLVLDGQTVDGTPVHIDMGLGKTIIGLTAAADWFRYGVCRRSVLIVAPIKVCETVWRQEALEWTHTKHLRFGLLRGNEKQRAYVMARAFDFITGERKTDVMLVNPELLGWLYKYIREDWGYFDAIIIDDCPLKDHRSKQFRTLSNYGTQKTVKDPFTGKSLVDAEGHKVKIPPHRFKRAAKLTGTPSTAGLHNLWSPMYLMDHGARLHRSYETFEGRFFHKTRQVATNVYEIDINAEEAESRPAYIAREGGPERIHELMADCTVELNAADYGVLPKVIGDASKGEPPPSHLHRVELPGEVRTQYERLEKEALIELEKDFIMASNGGAKSMMCWQMANGAIYNTDDFGQKFAVNVHDAKLDKLVELIDSLDANVLIPYYFQHDFARITARFQKEGMAFASLKGKNTQRIIDQWNAGNTPILLIHPQSAAHGLNLQFGGHHLIWFTMLWSLEKYLQTLARLARSGQNNIVGNHHIIASKTTDELMLGNLRQNGSDQDRFRNALREYQQLKGLGL